MSLFVIYVLINLILLLRLTHITSKTIGRKWNNLKFTRQQFEDVNKRNPFSDKL